MALAILLSVSGGAAEKLAESLVDRKIDKVGVIPVVISRQDDHHASVGSLGPRALTITRDLSDRLVQLSNSAPYRGKFSVVSQRAMKSALEGADGGRPLTVDDLGDLEKLRLLSNQTAANAFVVLDIDESISIVEPEGAPSERNQRRPTPMPELKIKGSVLGDDGTKLAAHDFQEINTLGAAAYSGESFEIRRWDRNRLENMGLSMPHRFLGEDSHWEFGKGDVWEQEHLRCLKRRLQHPLEIEDFPYDVALKVAGRVRKPERVLGEYIVPLEPGEQYSIQLTNNTSQPALVALYVDGVGTIDKQFCEPRWLDNARHWVLKPNYVGDVDGWYALKPENLRPQRGQRFVIAPRRNSIAAQQGFAGNLGMITALFYANDAVSGKYIDYPDDDLLEGFRSTLAEGAFGTSAGPRFERGITVSKVRRGLLLAAVTIYYRTPEEISAIRAGTSRDHVFMRLTAWSGGR
ncbi:MAG: hypothetical protein RIC55_12510 [Pirellulaceae bacterium]